MTASDQILFARTSDKDLAALSRFIIHETKNAKATPEYLRWWFFQNPVSASMQHAVANEKIAGMATTNNFRMSFEGNEKQVAMPQKVLTDAGLRGQGLFSKLYFKTEEENLQQNKIDFFLTFTNAASTPIFLKKFGYRNGISPDVFVIMPSATDFFRTKKYELRAPASSSQFQPLNIANAIVKNKEHFHWRYSLAAEPVTRISEGDSEIYLKRIFKNRIPFYAVLDFISVSDQSTARLIHHSLHYSVRKLAAGLLLMSHEIITPVIRRFVHFRIKNRFSFLVKGKDHLMTEKLSQEKFNFTFGDLDFI